MHGFDDGLRLSAASDVGLIGGDDEYIPAGCQLRACLRDTVKEFELLERARWIWFPVTYPLSIQRSISVQEHGRTPGRARRGKMAVIEGHAR